MEDIIKKTDEATRAEIKKYGLPTILNFETSYNKGIELAQKLGANLFVVQMGTLLMDFKLGEAFANRKLPEHVKMSSAAAKEFLRQFDLEPIIIDKIINCVEGHHKTIDWKYPEAEICANADCYRFLLAKNWLAFLYSLNERGDIFENSLKISKEKLEEKWDILSLEICKQELEPHYKLINELIYRAKTPIA